MWCKLLIGVVIPLVICLGYKLWQDLLEIDYIEVNLRRGEMCANYRGKVNEMVIEVAIECDFILMSNNSEYNVLYDCFKRSFGLEEFPSSANQYMDLYCSEDSDLKHKLNDECVREIFNTKGSDFESKFLEDTDTCMQERYALKEEAIELELEEEVNRRFKSGLEKEIEAQLKLIEKERLEMYQELIEDEDDEGDDEDDDPEGIWKD